MWSSRSRTTTGRRTTLRLCKSDVINLPLSFGHEQRRGVATLRRSRAAHRRRRLAALGVRAAKVLEGDARVAPRFVALADLSCVVLPLGVREPGADSCALQTVQARDQDHKSTLAASNTPKRLQRAKIKVKNLFCLEPARTAKGEEDSAKYRTTYSLNPSASAAAVAAGSPGRRPRRRARRRRRLD